MERNDSKMNSISKENIFKTVITVERKDVPDTVEKISSPRTEKITIDFGEKTPKQETPSK